MPYEEMLRWLLFYRSILDVEKLAPCDVVDPGGLVRSELLQSLTARFLADYLDAGGQHIAFATDDIFAASSALRANSMTMLRIPDNYYDDLDARFDLPADLLDRMRAGQILYDRDVDGEYFQIYTGNIAGWLFFEVVQRRDYSGFGASNAPIRLAAQTRAAPRRDMPRVRR